MFGNQNKAILGSIIISTTVTSTEGGGFAFNSEGIDESFRDAKDLLDKIISSLNVKFSAYITKSLYVNHDSVQLIAHVSEASQNDLFDGETEALQGLIAQRIAEAYSVIEAYNQNHQAGKKSIFQTVNNTLQDKNVEFEENGTIKLSAKIAHVVDALNRTISKNNVSEKGTQIQLGENKIILPKTQKIPVIKAVDKKIDKTWTGFVTFVHQYSGSFGFRPNSGRTEIFGKYPNAQIRNQLLDIQKNEQLIEIKGHPITSTAINAKPTNQFELIEIISC